MMEMTREMAIGKIHRAVVTGADLLADGGFAA